MMPVLRPDTTLLWVPDQMAAAMGLQRGQRLTEEQWQDREFQALIFSRQQAKGQCNAEWHEKQGYP